ncbi:MAG: imidazoleglycerol-phosphate dehydratase HisB [Anaerolineales bacterium]|nr:imidazoleglycerol-phosphate dehydratase HisB [Anaerolineales bacterium]
MRKATIERKTKETEIRVELDVDGTGRAEVETEIGFLDHMLDHVAVHGLFDLKLNAKGDTHVDLHHTVEDTALALGEAVKQALGDKRGLTRIGHAVVPMDEVLAMAVVDFCGRPHCLVRAEWSLVAIGQLPVTLIEHFFRSFSAAAGATVHVRLLERGDDHHQAEALFKAFGRALDRATQIDPRRAGSIPSTKGMI